MLWQIFGYTVFASIGVSGIAATGWLYRTATRPWTWQRKVRAPKIAAEPYFADDYSVGNV